MHKKIKNNKLSNFTERFDKKERKTPDFLTKYRIQIIITALFVVLLSASFTTIYNSFLNLFQIKIFNMLKMPFYNLYFMEHKLSFPNFFAINFFVILLVLILFFILYLKKINAIKNRDDFINKFVFFIIIFFLYFFFLGFVFSNKFLILQIILFVGILFYFFIYTIYYDTKNNVSFFKFNYLTKNEFKILIFYSLFILILNIFDYKSWKYSYIGDEWAFFEYAKGIINGKVNPDIFSESGVYGYHPVLSSIWQAFIMFITDKNLFGWKLSSAVIVPLVIIPFYIWHKLVFNRTVAIIATCIFSIANAMMAFSHIGYNNIQTIFFYVMTLFLLEIAIRKKSNFYLILTALIMGLGFYTFYSSRLIIIIALIYVIFHPEKNKFRLKEFIIPFILFIFIILPIVLRPEFFQHILRQTAITGSEIQKSEERPVYFFLNFIYSFFSFLSKSRNSHFMVDGLLDIFSAIGMLFGLIWTLVAFIKDWRAQFLLLSYIFLILFIGALHQYHYPVNTRLMFLIPILSTISGVGLSRMAFLITYFKKSKKIYTITVIIICFIIFLLNFYNFYIKMPDKLQFTIQAYLIKFLQKYKKYEKIIVISQNIVNLEELIRIYNLKKDTVICSLQQFESILKENKVKNKAVIFDYSGFDIENKIKRIIKPGYIYRDNNSKKILFYIYDFTKDIDYYNGFYELWTTGKTNYVLKTSELRYKDMEKTEVRNDKETIKKTIQYKVNNKSRKFKFLIYKNFQFEKSYSAKRSSEIKNYKITKMSFDKPLLKPSDISFDDNMDILFVADSNQKKIMKFKKKKDDMFVLSTIFNIPGKIQDKKENEEIDGLFCVLNKQKKLLYILDAFEGKIFETTYDAGEIKEIIQSNNIKYSTDISLDEYGHFITISNPEENTIMIFSNNGDLINVYSTTWGFGEGQMNRPVSSEVINDNYLIIADSMNGRVQLFDNDFNYIKNYRIGVCTQKQLPDISYVNHPAKPYFVITQPSFKKIFIFFLKEDAFRYINLNACESYKFLNVSKITQCKDNFYLLDNIGKTIVRLQLPHNFIFEKVDFAPRR